MLTFGNTQPRRKLEVARVFPVVSKGSEVSRALETVVEPVDVVVHTYREVHVQWRKEVGIEQRVVGLVAVGKLRVGYELQGIEPPF